MLKVNYYKRPFASITIGGEKVRITPGVIVKFIKPISDNKINIHALSTGESSFSIYIDEADFEKAFRIISEVKNESHTDVIVKKNLGMVSVQGPEIPTMPGLLYLFTEPIAREGINIEGIANSYDSVVFFFDFGKSRKAYELICEKIEKNPKFRERKKGKK
ncbi:MAG: ACT domain-containing protein [Candidatus Micrarchaeia archaeon]